MDLPRRTVDERWSKTIDVKTISYSANNSVSGEFKMCHRVQFSSIRGVRNELLRRATDAASLECFTKFFILKAF